MDRCRDEDEWLDYADGLLPRAAADEAAAHLSSCEQCRRKSALLAGIRAESALNRPFPSPQAERKVLAAIESASRVTAPMPTRISLTARWVVAASIFCATAASLIGVGMRSVMAESIVATVVSADGLCVVRRDGVDLPVEAGMNLYDGDRLAVPAETSMALDLSDETRAELGPESLLLLHEPKNGEARVDLQKGFLAMDAGVRLASEKLTVVTPGARADVIGTQFTMGVDGDVTHLRVAEGVVHLVRIDDGASIDVSGGNRAEVADDDRSTFRAMPALPGTALIIASHDREPVEFARFNSLVGHRLLGRRLRHLGMRVEMKWHADVTSKDLVGRPLVIVSYSEEGVGFEESLERIDLKNADVPVLCLEPVVFSTLGMCGPTRGVDFDWQGGATAIEFPNPDHPLAGGLSGIHHDIFVTPGCFGWALPAGESQTIATVEGDHSRVVMFAFESGHQMVQLTAPRRRVGLFVDPSQVGEDSEPAWRLVEAAVEWCVEPPMEKLTGDAN